MIFLPPLALALLIAPAQPHHAPPRCINLADGDLNQPRTLSQPCYNVHGFVTAHAPITIAPATTKGTTLYFGQDDELDIAQDASLHAQGTSKSPIFFMGRDSTPGYWRGLRFESHSMQNLLFYAIVAGCGSSSEPGAGAVTVSTGAMLAIEHTTIQNTIGNALYLDQRATLSAFDSTLFFEDDIPINLKASDLNMLGASILLTGNKHSVVYVHFNDSDVKSDATWRALDVPYEFHASPSIQAHVTIEPGVHLEFAANDGLSIEENGSLTAQGTSTKPILFTGTQDTPGYWAGLDFQSRSLQNLLSYAIIEDCGSSSYSEGGAVEVGSRAEVAIDHTSIGNSIGNGLYLNQNASLAAFAANRFYQDDIPINLKASDLDMLDTATTFTGNKHNVVYVHFNDSDVKSDATWRALAVPYEFHTNPSIQAHLTIQPGARLEFAADQELSIEENGSLTAQGTSAHPIVFTGKQSTPGYWQGIYFSARSLQNILQNSSILYGGALDGVGRAGVGLGPNSSATIQNSEIGYSQGAAISVGQNAQLNTDAATSNRLHDNGAGIVSIR